LMKCADMVVSSSSSLRSLDFRLLIWRGDEAIAPSPHGSARAPVIHYNAKQFVTCATRAPEFPRAGLYRKSTSIAKGWREAITPL
jgi:hypothetical protein